MSESCQEHLPVEQPAASPPVYIPDNAGGDGAALKSARQSDEQHAAGAPGATPPPNGDAPPNGAVYTAPVTLPPGISPPGPPAESIWNHPAVTKARDAGNAVLAHAMAYDLAGISVVQVKLDGSKAPEGKWERYQRERPNAGNIEAWFRLVNKVTGHAIDQPGIGTVCGKVSNNLELIDFDSGDLFAVWSELVESQHAGLVARLNIVQTPRDPAGYHVRYRCAEIEIPGNTKLALKPGTDPKTGKPKNVTLIETRGEGGQGLAPGGNPKAHPSGHPYAHIGGPHLTALPVITSAERDILFTAARSFDLSSAPKPKKPVDAPHEGTVGLRPGDDFDLRGPSFEDLLCPHGWEVAYCRGSVTYWRRPGKDTPGYSATTGYCKGDKGEDLFAVFSSNADPFPGPSGSRPCSCHGKFDVYTRLNHGGNYSAAAKALAAEEYGDRRSRRAGGDPENVARSESCDPGALTGYNIILDYFRKHYAPAFRRGPLMYSDNLGREVKASEACAHPGIKVIDLLKCASDVPTDKEGCANRNQLPHFFGIWAKVAWRDLLDSLPEEECTEVVADSAEQEFRHHVASALHTQVTFGMPKPGKGSKQDSVPERRSAIDWCVRFAKSGPWKQIRSLKLWTRAHPTTEGYPVVEVALRAELFGQLPYRDLAKLSQPKFARLCAIYNVGSSDDDTRVCGQRAVVLSREFVESLVADPNPPALRTAASAAQEPEGRQANQQTSHASGTNGHYDAPKVDVNHRKLFGFGRKEEGGTKAPAPTEAEEKEATNERPKVTSDILSEVAGG